LKTCLPDINVWVALASDRHVHHGAAKNWFDGITPREAAFCRITQMGFLRLVTNRHVMGADVVAQREAWRIYQELSRDGRVVFFHEPSGIESEWRRLTQSNSASTNSWNDAYLAAFASIRDLKVVSFDRGFARLSGASAIILV
jgi:toxin-antitoxin system PIN domain toxin